MAGPAASPPPGPSAPVAVTPPAGLSGAEVAERVSRGLTNAGGEHTSRSVAHILRANILTRFNLILGVLLAVILAVGQPQDALFGIVLVTNALIGIGQELRAKRTLDRLAVLSAPRVRLARSSCAMPISALATSTMPNRASCGSPTTKITASRTPRIRLNRVKMFARRISPTDRLG